MPKKNTETTKESVEVYTHKINELADEYIDALDNPEDIYKPQTSYFNGMIKYIYRNYFKQHPVDYADIEYLDSIWDMYTSLCYKYNKSPTIIEFCLLINIARDTLWDWKEKKTRNYKYYTADGVEIKDFIYWKNKHPGEEYVRELSTKHCDTVKKWLAECENSLYRGATEGGKIGCIFALKANYGYVETAPMQVAAPQQQVQADAELQQLPPGWNCAKLEDNSSKNEL